MTTIAPACARPEVRGKFLWLEDRKLYVKGVTYGTFRPGDDGVDYPAPDVVERDFAGMAAAGFNTIRTYTVPPRWLLDAAHRHGVFVMVGLPWEQHIAFLSDRKRAASIEQRVREGVRACAGHPAILCFTIGNEIPASIVRWHGRKAIERFLHRLYRAAKAEDPGGLVTYVNFPTTEYLELPFLDFCAFNVYLEDEERLSAYLGRLQIVAGDRPLVMAEIGLDSRRNGEQAQADALRWQLRTVFRAGCAGATVFAWTDEWYRGGHEIEDWDFGLVRRDRTPKLALDAVTDTMAELPLPPDPAWPRISVVVCSYNGSATLDETLAAMERLEYPDYEVLLVDDGSTDETAEIGHRHGVRVISTPNRGLSSARNTGAEEATGEIVAYCDDDAYPDPHWLTYLAITYTTTDHVAVGGPNIAPPEDGPIADCIANAPGNPIHVLLTDSEAEHIPGCNSSFRRDVLLGIGGFDTRFRIAGDDVDVCWRLEQAGGTIGFNPAAVVWHHRRPSVKAFWRQQRNYGRAEALLERKWPDKYNWFGHVSWAGRVYSPGRRTFMERWKVYYGTWGSGFFQRLYSGGQPELAALPLMPEWFLVIGLLAALTALGALWAPLLSAAPLCGLAIAAVLGEAWVGAGRAQYATPPATRRARLRMRARTAFLFVLQSYARLHGRIAQGLAPWSRRSDLALALPRVRSEQVWSETWQAPETWLEQAEERIATTGVRVRRGGDFDHWDLRVRGGAGGEAELRMAVEEHGAGKQLLRFRLMPRPRLTALVLGAISGVLGITAAATGDHGAAAPLLLIALTLHVGSLLESTAAVLVARDAVRGLVAEPAVAAVEPEPEPEREPEPAAALAGATCPWRPRLEQLLDDVQPGEIAAVVADLDSSRRAVVDLLAALHERDDDDAFRGSRQVGVVLRDPILGPLTVAENIALNRPDATREEVEDAARTAGAHDVVKRLPDGYDTVLDSAGPPLSRAERMRLAMARSFLQDTPILVLGEPLGAAGDQAVADRGPVVVTEGLADVPDAGRVLVLDGGEGAGT